MAPDPTAPFVAPEAARPRLSQAKQVAAREGTTLRALIEDGLRRVLDEREARAPVVLRRATFRGEGVHPDVREGAWERVRDLIYEGRGA